MADVVPLFQPDSVLALAREFVEVQERHGNPTTDEMPAEAIFRMGALMVAAPTSRRGVDAILALARRAKKWGLDELADKLVENAGDAVTEGAR